MLAWLPRWLRPKVGPSLRPLPRPPPGPRHRPRSCRLEVEELESRLTPSAGGTGGLNTPITTDPGVQQMPSVAVDPADPNHVVIAYMDHSLVTTGYAGIGVAVSRDGGDSWQRTALPLPAGFDQGASNPIAQFDGQGHVFVSFMSVTFKGTYESPLTNDNFENRGAPGTTSNNGLFEVRSDDGGLSWQQPVAIVSHLYDGTHPVYFEAIPDLAIDGFPTLPNGQRNPNFGNQYLSWTRVYPAGQFPGDPNSTGGTDIMVAVSKDGGQTWRTQLENVPGISTPVTVIQDLQDTVANGGGSGNPLGIGFEDQANVTVGPDGDVYIAYTSGLDFSVAHSTNAGASFAIPDYINPPDGSLALRVVFGNGDNVSTPESGLGNGNRFRTFPVRDIVADPTRPGYVYVASATQITDPKGNTLDPADVLFARSTDYGLHWTTTFRLDPNPNATVLNDDNGGQSATGLSTDVTSGQADPRLSIDTQGNISVIWYDTRRDPAGHLLDVFGTTSTDGGQTFSPNFRVTDQSVDANQGVFKNPTTQSGGPEVVINDGSGLPLDVSGQDNYNLGEYLGLALANNTAYATWTDTRGGNQDVYFSRFSLVLPPAPPNDRFEPNDTTSAATDLGKVVQLLEPKLALPAGDEDWFRVQAAATGNLTVSANSAGDVALPPNMLQLQLWNVTGTNLLATGSDRKDPVGKLVGQDLVYISNAGQGFLVRVFRTHSADTDPIFYALGLQSLTVDLGTRVVADVSGTLAAGGLALYRLTAAAAGSLQVQFTNGANVQRNLNLQVVDANTSANLIDPPVPGTVSAPEPNDSIGQADPTGLVGLGSVQLAGVIGDGALGTTSGDYDFYSLQAGAGQRIAVTLDPKGSRLDGVILLYDSAGNLLQLEDNNGPGVGEFLSFVTTKADTYYVALFGYGDGYAGFGGGEDPPSDPFTPGTGHGVGKTGSYVLTISKQAVGPGAIQQYAVPVQQGQAVFLLVSGEENSTGDYGLKITNLDQFSTPDSPSLLFPAGAGPSSEAVGDVNGDGLPDVVVANALSNTVSVLLNNGDGTFQAPRQFAIGGFKVPNPTGGGFHLNDFRRQVALVDLNHDGKFDIVVTNFDSGDVSVLLGRGDGTFEPQRRFDATPNPWGLAVGDVNGDGIPDIVAIDSQQGDATVAVLLGRGDGTFQPERTFPAGIGVGLPFSTVYLADLNGDGKLDLLVSGSNVSSVSVFPGHGDGTFEKPSLPPAGRLAAGVIVADINGDGIPDIVNTGVDPSGLGVVLGNEIQGKGAGTFTPYLNKNSSAGLFPAGPTPVAVAVADFATGVAILNPDGSSASTTTTLGKPDGHPDLIVAASGGVSSIVPVGSPGIYVVPTLWDAQGSFEGLGAPLLLAPADVPLDVKVADVNGDGVPDVLALDANGVRVIYGKKPTIKPNDTPQTARNLGTVVHLVEPTQTLVPGHQLDAYYTLTVPTEIVRGAGNEVIDFSGFFQAQEGAGLSMEVTAAGNVLGSGERFRVVAKQGAVLTLHFFGKTAQDGSHGAGAYTLDINVLPQLVSVESQPLLPGQSQNPGGPTASLVLTFQGDRLDPTSAENPAHYRVTWLGPDGVAGTSDDQVIAVRGAVYDPSTNVSIASGNVYPTAIRQTVTLLFTDPLPAGSYQIELSAGIQTAAFNEEEQGLVAGAAGLTGHPVVSLSGSQVTEGARRTARDLVFAAGALGDFGIFQTGTPFLTQLHDDLGALLDAELSRRGDHPAIPGTIDDQILDRFDPALGPLGQRPVAVLVIWLDPVSPTLLDSRGSRVVYDQQDSSFVNTLSKAYVNVTGNLEVIVLPFVASTTETLRLSVADVASTVRGGVLYFGADRNEVRPLTADLRSGTTEFLLSYGSTSPPPSPVTSLPPVQPPLPLPPGPGPDPGKQPASISQGGVDSESTARAAFTLVGTRTDSAPVSTVGPFFQVNAATASAGPGGATTQASGQNTSQQMANSSGLGGLSPEPPDTPPEKILKQLAEMERTMPELAEQIRAWVKTMGIQLPDEGNRSTPKRPRTEKMPMQQPPEEEEEPLSQTQEVRQAPEELSPEAEVSVDCVVSVVGLGVCVVGVSASGPIHRCRRRGHSLGHSTS